MPRTITGEVHPLVKLLCEDDRYKLDAYTFVREGLQCAQQILYPPTGERELEGKLSRHVTGQDLCHALRHLAHDRFGYLALPVPALHGGLWRNRVQPHQDRRDVQIPP